MHITEYIFYILFVICMHFQRKLRDHSPPDQAIKRNGVWSFGHFIENPGVKIFTKELQYNRIHMLTITVGTESNHFSNFFCVSNSSDLDQVHVVHHSETLPFGEG